MSSLSDLTTALYSAFTKAEVRRQDWRLSFVHGPSVSTARETPALNFTRIQNKVGGGEGLEGVYGSITRVGTSEVLDVMAQYAALGPGSIVLDIGSGLGRCGSEEPNTLRLGGR